MLQQEDFMSDHQILDQMFDEPRKWDGADFNFFMNYSATKDAFMASGTLKHIPARTIDIPIVLSRPPIALHIPSFFYSEPTGLYRVDLRGSPTLTAANLDGGTFRFTIQGPIEGAGSGAPCALTISANKILPNGSITCLPLKLPNPGQSPHVPHAILASWAATGTGPEINIMITVSLSTASS
jgi:hypothetical protein